MYPLAKHCREILLHGPRAPKPKPRRPPASQTAAPDAAFVRLWQDLIGALHAVAAAHDQLWQVRRRVLNTLLVMLFVFRLVFAPRRQGYTATLAELWDHCRALDVPLPQPTPVCDAAMVRARRKVHPEVFQQFHAAILRRADRPLWYGHRVFAVDGCKLNLPRPLHAAGYALPNPQAHYPQGLLSCLYRLHSKLPVDFDLHAHGDERAAAHAHLAALAADDLVVYDRGYYSFALLCAHRQRGRQAVFRIRRKAGRALNCCIASDQTDTVAEILPGPAALRDLRRKHPSTPWQPVPLRLLKYTHGGTEYVLGTTLLDRQRYSVAASVAALADLYHARWGIEELYKISKQFLEVDQFHGRTESLLKQELFAHFNLIAITRSFTNHDAVLCQAAAAPTDARPLPQANFKHSLAAVSRHLEALLLRHTEFVRETVTRIAECVGIGRRRPRPNRSYPRRSKQPAPKWSRRKPVPA